MYVTKQSELVRGVYGGGPICEECWYGSQYLCIVHQGDIFMGVSDWISVSFLCLRLTHNNITLSYGLVIKLEIMVS